MLVLRQDLILHTSFSENFKGVAVPMFGLSLPTFDPPIKK